MFRVLGEISKEMKNVRAKDILVFLCFNFIVLFLISMACGLLMLEKWGLFTSANIVGVSIVGLAILYIGLLVLLNWLCDE